MKIQFMPWLKPALSFLLLTVMTVLPCCACGSSSFLVGFLTKKVHCADIGSLSPQSLKLPFIIGNKKVCLSALNPPASAAIIQTLPFILPLLRQEVSGVSDVFSLLTRVRPTLNVNGKKKPPSPEKVFLALTQDEVTDGERFRLLNEFRQLIDKQRQLTKEKENRSSIYIAMINEGLRAVVVPGQVIPEFLFNSVRHWLLDAELALYLQILPEADWLDLLPELQAIAAAGDDGDPDREPDNDPEPALFIAGESGVQPWLAGLYTEAVLQKHRLLGILRQRVRQAIASGNYELVKILQNRIMVIGADLSELENAESQVFDSSTLQALLLQGLLENSGEVQTYAAGNLAVEVPTDKKRSTSNRGATAAKKIPAKQQALSGPDGKPFSSPHNSDSSGDDPGPEQQQHTYNNQPCPVCREPVCKETEPVPANPVDIDKPCFFLTLPQEILVKIFENNSHSERKAIMGCCKRFADAARDTRVVSSHIQSWLKGKPKPPDILFPMGAAMSAALEAKIGVPLDRFSPEIKQTLALSLKLAPSFCTHTIGAKVQKKHKWHYVATFPDGRIVSGLDRVLRVWSLKEDGSGLCTHTLKGHTEVLTSVATLSDCWVISSSWYHKIKIWDLRRPDGKYCTDTVNAHTSTITTIKTLPDMWFYSGSFDNTVRVWRLTQEGKALLKHTLSVWEVVTCLKVLPEGQLFAGTRWGKINFWEATKADEAPLTKRWRAFNGKVNCIELLSNGLLLTHSSINAVRTWEFNQPEITTFTFPYIVLSFREVRCSAVFPEGLLTISTKSAKMEIFTFNHHNTYSVYTKKTGDSNITSIAFFQDGRMITGSSDGTAKIWDYSDTLSYQQP